MEAPDSGLIRDVAGKFSYRCFNRFFYCLVFGCLVLVAVLVFLRHQKHAIIGYWQNADDSVVIEFRPDGTFRTRGAKPDAPVGRYSFNGFHKLRVELPGANARTEVARVSVGLREMTVQGMFPVKLHRVDASKMIPATPEQEIRQYMQDRARAESNQAPLFLQRLTNR